MAVLTPHFLDLDQVISIRYRVGATLIRETRRFGGNIDQSLARIAQNKQFNKNKNQIHQTITSLYHSPPHIKITINFANYLF